MIRTKCHFCGFEGPEREDPFDALDAAMHEDNFHRIDIPFRESEGKVGARVRFLCGDCSWHTEGHFLSRPKRKSKPLVPEKPLTAKDVLVPLDEDENFEEDKDW